MFVFSLVIFVASLVWLAYEPGFEPGITAISSFAAMLFTESHIRNFCSKKYLEFRAKKLIISNGEILLNDNELMNIMRQLSLGKEVDFRVSNQEDRELETHAKKKVNDKNEQYNLLSYIDRRKKKLALSKHGIEKIAALFRKGFIQCEINDLPAIVRRFVSIVYPPTIDSVKLNSQNKEKSFDIYSSSVSERQLSFIANIPETDVQELMKSLKIESLQEMCQPHKYSALEIPSRIFYQYVLPAQILYGLRTYKNESGSDDYWAVQLWSIGPH